MDDEDVLLGMLVFVKVIGDGINRLIMDIGVFMSEVNCFFGLMECWEIEDNEFFSCCCERL